MHDVSQVLTNLMEALKLLAGARPPIPSPGLNLLLSLTPPRPVGAVGDPTVGGSPQMVKRECEAAWLCIQSECQALLADIAAAPSLQAAARSDAGGLQLPAACTARSWNACSYTG